MRSASLVETAIASAEHIEAAHAAHGTGGELTELVADRGYHSNQMLIDFAALGVRCYIAKPDWGRRHWTRTSDAQRVVYNCAFRSIVTTQIGAS